MNDETEINSDQHIDESLAAASAAEESIGVNLQVPNIEPKEEWVPRKLCAPIDGFDSYQFDDAVGDCITFYVRHGTNVVKAKRIWEATLPATNKYKAGMLRPADYKPRQILEVDDRGVDIYTPLSRKKKFYRSISRALHGLAQWFYPT